MPGVWESRGARAGGIALLAALVICGGGMGWAQKQDEKLLDRVSKAPDMSMINPMQEKAFDKTGGVSVRESRMADAKVFGLREYRSGESKMTRSFLGIKNPWLGPKVFDTRPAYLGSGGSMKTDKVVPLRGEVTREYVDAGRSEADGARVVATRPYLGRGSAQGSMDLLTEAAKRELTADELRELLNKPR